MNLYPGTVMLHSAILVSLRNMKHVQCSFYRNPHCFIGCFIVFKRCSFEHMNKRTCEQLWEQPNSLAAFFFYQLMIVFSFCEQLVEDISVHHVNYCFFNKLICSVTDRTNRLPYSYSEDDVTG